MLEMEQGNVRTADVESDVGSGTVDATKTAGFGATGFFTARLELTDIGS